MVPIHPDRFCRLPDTTLRSGSAGAGCVDAAESPAAPGPPLGSLVREPASGLPGWLDRCRGPRRAARGRSPVPAWRRQRRPVCRADRRRPLRRAFSEQGKESTFAIAERSHWFGEVALLDGGRRTHDAFAESRTTLAHVPLADITRWLETHPAVLTFSPMSMWQGTAARCRRACGTRRRPGLSAAGGNIRSRRGDTQAAPRSCRCSYCVFGTMAAGTISCRARRPARGAAAARRRGAPSPGSTA